MKKLFSRCSWLITVLICLGILFSVKTFAKDSAADDSLSGSLGKNITWTLEGSSDSGYTIRISGSGDTPDYDYTSDIPWYSHINEIKSVIVEDGITGLGKSSFYKSTSIQSVKLADSVRSIGEMCFFRNGSLEKIELGNGLTSIGEAAFSVSNLKKVSLPIGITHIESDTFYGCKQLESINLEHVKSIGRKAFPFKPIERINLSIKKAILDMYPLSSRIARKKYKRSIKGTNTKTPPSPPISPSTTNDCNQSGVPCTKIPTYFPRKSAINPSTQSISGPEPLNVKVNTVNIIRTKAIGPKNLFSKTLSILSEISNLFFNEVVKVLFKIPLTLPCLASAKIVSISSSYSFTNFAVYELVKLTSLIL